MKASANIFLDYTYILLIFDKVPVLFIKKK